MKLGDALISVGGKWTKAIEVEFHGTMATDQTFPSPTTYNIPPAMFDDLEASAAAVDKVCSLVASAMPGMPIPDASFALAVHAALYQDDDAHETCSLTACLNPLHPGPCKGWKGNLFKVAPNAYHALESARVEKANSARLKKIQALKDAGKPIPKKLLQPIVAKPHPHAGKTANAATGEAHHAGQAVTDAAGVHVQMPGKVTLGQAVKQIKATDATPDKGPKGKKPTVASKGIAAVIAQEKVTPQYKLDKAAKITPEQWNALSSDEKSIVRGELAKIQTEGFGPQQKKATELLDALPAEGLKGGGTDTVTTPKGLVVQKVSLKEAATPPTLSDKVAKVKEEMSKGTSLADSIKKVTGKEPVLPEPETPAKAKIHTYTVTHNGVTYTRKSKHVYTHAAVIQKPDGTSEVWSFHKSEEAALKNGGGLTAEAKKNGFKVLAALPVTKVEPGKKNEPKVPDVELPEEPKAHAGASSAAQAAAIATISDAIPGIKSMPEGASAKLVEAFDKLKAKGNLEDTPQFKAAVSALANKALKVAAEDKMPGLGHGDNDAHIGTFHKEISEHILAGKPGLPPLVAKMAAHHEAAAPKNVKEGIEQAAKAAHDEKVAKAKLGELTPGTPGTVTTPSGKTYQKVELKPETPKIENAAESAPKAPELPKHVQHAVDIANHEAPGAGLSKNHLAAYQKLSPEEFGSLPEATQGKILQELEKGQTKFLDPKKIAASKELITKFKAGKASIPAAPEAAEPDFYANMKDHSVTDAQAKKAAAGQPVAAHAAVAKEYAGLETTDQPDVMAHQLAAKEYGKNVLANFTAGEPLEALKDPAVQQAAQNVLDTVTAVKQAQLIGQAKKNAYNKIDKVLKGDTGQLSPIQKASLAEYQKYLLAHPSKTEPADITELQSAVLDATDDLKAKLKAAKAPKAADMTPAQLDSKVAELLGPDAVKPQVNLSLAELKEANATGQKMAELGTEKYSKETLENPNVAAKQKLVAQYAGQLAATSENSKKLNEHLKKHHFFALNEYTYGNGTLSEADKKVIEAHAAKIKQEHAYIDTVMQQQQDDLIKARKAFDDAANEVQNAPHEPVTLSGYDQGVITEAYGNNWGKQASKAVVYGVKTYSQKLDMKAHPEYAPFTQDLGNLQTAVKNLALAHAAEHVSGLNVPTDPNTGAKLAGPEKQAWLAAVQARMSAEQDYNKLYKVAQTKLDKIRTDVGLKKRALPKIDSPAVKAAAAESAYYKTAGYGGPNYGKHAAAKSYTLAKVGPKLGIKHQTASEKKAEKAAAEAEKLKAAHPDFYAKKEADKAKPKPTGPSVTEAGTSPNKEAAEKFGWNYVPETAPELGQWGYSTKGAYYANEEHLKAAQAILTGPDIQHGLAAQKQFKWSINNMEGKGASHASKSSLYSYTGSGYDSVNTKLNSLPPGVEKTGSSTITNIDNGMAASPPLEADVVLYRGFKSPHSVFSSGKWNDTNVAGMEWSQRSYSSTSGALTTAQSFAGHGGVVMRIIVPKDMKVHGINAKGGQHGGENEIILQRGLRYRVVADYGKHGNQRYIDVMVVPSPYAKSE